MRLKSLTRVTCALSLLLQLCSAASVAQVHFITPDTSLYLSYSTSPLGVFATGTIPRTNENFSLIDYTSAQLTSGDMVDLITPDNNYFSVESSGSISFSTIAPRAFKLIKFNTTFGPLINDGDAVYLLSSTLNTTCYPVSSDSSLSCTSSTLYFWNMDVLPPTNRTYSSVGTVTSTVISGWVCQIGFDQNISIAMYIGGPFWNGGVLVKIFPSGVTSEPAIAKTCLANGTSYRFSISYPASALIQFPGKPIYLYAIPNDQPSAIIPFMTAGSIFVPSNSTTNPTNPLARHEVPFRAPPFWFNFPYYAADVMDLFQSEYTWPIGSSRVGVIKMYSQFATENNLYDLTKLVRFVKKKGMFLAVEFGPLVPSETCGTGIEGFTGSYAISLSQYVLACGGTLDYVAFDEPFFYAHYYQGPDACNWELNVIALNAYNTVKVLQSVFPDVVIGDIEPINNAVSNWPQTLALWLSTYENISCTPFSFLEWDVAWNDLENNAQSLISVVQGANVSYSVIFNGLGYSPPTDTAWMALAEKHIQDYFNNFSLPIPNISIVQTWSPSPEYVTPETNSTAVSPFCLYFPLSYITSTFSLL